jgi:hypothetical protein
MVDAFSGAAQTPLSELAALFRPRNGTLRYKLMLLQPTTKVVISTSSTDLE